MNRKVFLALITTVLLVAAVASFAADKPQTVCPVSREAIDKAKSPHVDYQGKRVYLCCDKCIAPFKKDPVKYLNKLPGEQPAMGAPVSK